MVQKAQLSIHIARFPRRKTPRQIVLQHVCIARIQLRLDGRTGEVPTSGPRRAKEETSQWRTAAARLLHWDLAPHARAVYPREEQFVSLPAAVGAAEN
jgi:hypothetical protein